jgi:ADP-ribose pyrophosphatase YjhB (NUDIX family)
MENKSTKNNFPRGLEIVTGAIMQKDGKILLAKSPKWSNKWTLPGGHIEPGESIMEAAKREAEEETGLRLKFVKILAFGELINPKDFHRPAHFVFFACIFDVLGGELKLQEDELSESKWVTPQEALELDLAESYPETVEKYLEFLGETKK